MEKSILWSLRLGFSARQAPQIEKLGIEGFLRESFSSRIDNTPPELYLTLPKTIEEFTAYKKIINADPVTKKEYSKAGNTNAVVLEKWWLEKIYTEALPLREKMVVFLHNHFVTSSKKVKVYYWLYEHNKMLRENAFGNFRELTKKAIKTNAMLQYLDNNANRKGRINENLSRELLELFTIGVGHYSEQDIKNGAIGLAGLYYGEGEARYQEKNEINEPFTYLGEKGNFKADEIVDIIFKQKNTAYFLTRKLLKWFVYDNPSEELVTYYGDYFRKQDYEIKDLLVKMFTEEYAKSNAGSKIKDPLVYVMQVLDELGYKNLNYERLQQFTRVQSMELYNQLNVKGWDGGKNWLTAQLFVHRNEMADQVCKGRLQGKPVQITDGITGSSKVTIPAEWKNGDDAQVVKNLTNRLLFRADDTVNSSINRLIPEGFNPKGKDGDYVLLSLYNYLIKTPEFQVI